MSFKLEDEYGRPWTASANLGWLTLAAVLTFGMAAPLLGVYLSLWIRSKGRSLAPLVRFSLCLASFLGLPFTLLGHPVLMVTLENAASTMWVVLWIAAPFTLRHEIRRYYKEREGWDIEIGPFFTLFFSALYINYCLNPITFSERDPATTLNLRK
jgi:hypothetical protein